MTEEKTIQIYRKYSRRLYNTSYRIVGSDMVAEEIVHDTLLKYYRSVLLFLSEEQEAAWLTKTCIRKSIDHLRKKRREELFIAEYTKEQSTDDSTSFETAIDTAKLIDTIEKVPQNMRLILNLVLLEGLQYNEISKITGIKEVTLRSQFSRAKTRLTELLKK